MRRLVIWALLVMLLAAPALSEGLTAEALTQLLSAAGYDTDNSSLRGLVRSVAASEKVRFQAVELLQLRGVREVSEDIQAALTQDLSDIGLVVMARALAAIDAEQFEDVVAQTVSRIREPSNKQGLALFLVWRGRREFYPLLLDGLTSEDWFDRERTLRGLATLAVKRPPGPLNPDPFSLLLVETQSLKPLVPGREQTERHYRKAANWQLASVVCESRSSDYGVAALRALHRVTTSSADKEVRYSGHVAYTTLVSGFLTNGWPVSCQSTPGSEELALRFAGRSVADDDLRALVRSPQEREDLRRKAVAVLVHRGVEASSSDFRAALREAGSELTLAVCASGLLSLEGPQSASAVIDTAGRLKSQDLKLYLAQDLAHRGEAGLYSVLVESLKGEREINRHIALGGIAALSRMPTAGFLEPDPAKVLVETLAAGAPSLRLEAAETLGEANYAGATEERRLSVLKALQAAAAGDPAPEVRAAAIEAVKALEKPPAESAPVSPPRANALDGAAP